MDETIKLPDLDIYNMPADVAKVVQHFACIAVEQNTAELRAEVERLREVLKELIQYAKGVHDPHLEELIRDFLKETK